MKKGVNTAAILAATGLVCLAVTAINQAAEKKEANAAAKAAATKVAVVDIVTVFDSFEQTKVLNKKLDAHTRALGEEAEKRSKEVDAEQQALGAFAPDSADWYKQNLKVKEMVFKNEVWRQVERDQIGENHKRWVQRTYTMMTGEIEKVAKSRGIDIVLTREKLKPDVGDSKALLAQILNIKVVYASSEPGLDLTEEVLANLNAEFQKKGGAASVEFTR